MIKRVDVRRTTIEKKMDHMLRTGREMRRVAAKPVGALALAHLRAERDYLAPPEDET